MLVSHDFPSVLPSAIFAIVVRIILICKQLSTFKC